MLNTKEPDVESLSAYELSQLFGDFESDFDSGETSDSSIDDPINNPQPSTSTGITHPKIKKKKLSKRKFNDGNDEDYVLSQFILQEEALKRFQSQKKQKITCPNEGSSDSDGENNSGLMAYVELLQFQEYMRDTDCNDNYDWEAFSQETIPVSSGFEPVEHPCGSSNHSQQLQSGLDKEDTNENEGGNNIDSTDANAENNTDEEMLDTLIELYSRNDNNYNVNNNNNINSNSNNNKNKDDSPDSSLDSTENV